MMLCMGGTASKLFPTTVLPRKRVMRAEFNTHESNIVQVLAHKKENF